MKLKEILWTIIKTIGRIFFVVGTCMANFKLPEEFISEDIYDEDD